MNGVENIAQQIRDAVPHIKQGTLRFWGHWFGRPYDNIHEITGAEAVGDALRIYFDQGEILSVWSPHGVTIDEMAFRISGADRVRWEWHYYGRARIPANLCYLEFTRDGDKVSGSANVDWGSPNLQGTTAQPAVEIV